MSAQLESLIVDLQVNSAALKTGLDKANAHLKKFGDKFDGAARQAAAARQSIQNFGKSIAAAFGTAAVVGFAKTSLHAYMEMEKGQRQLSGSLEKLGYNSKALSGQLNAQAAAFQSNLGVSDDMVTKMQTLLVSFGVAPKKIEKTVAAILDYSALMGKDAVQATQKLVTAINKGSVESLKEMGITLTDTGDHAKNLDAAVEAMAKRFGGSAASAADTLAGKVATMGNQWEDLQKSFGGFLAQLNDKLGIMEKINHALADYNYLLGSEGAEDGARIDREKEQLRALERVQRAKDRIAATERFNADPSNAGYMGAKDIEAGRKKMAAELADAMAALAKIRGEREARAAAALKTPSLATQERSKDAAAAAKAAEAEARAKGRAENDARMRDFAAGAEKQGTAWSSTLEGVARQFEADAKERRAVEAALRQSYEEAEAGRLALLEREASAFRETLRAADARLKEFSDSLIGAALGLVQSAAGRLGRGGSLLNAGLAGAQQGAEALSALGPVGMIGGGFAGAYVSTMTELVTSTEGFGKVVAAMDSVVGRVSETLFGNVFGAFAPLIEAFTHLATSFDAIIVPATKAFAASVGMWVPYIAEMGNIIGSLVRMFATMSGLGDAMEGSISSSIRGMHFLSDGLRRFASSSLRMAIDIAALSNGLVSGIANFLERIAGTEIAGVKPFEFLDALSLELRKFGTIDTGPITLALDAVEGFGKTVDDVNDDVPPPFEELTNAVKKTTEAFLNAPEGYKTALARFNATEPGGAGSALSVFGKQVPIPGQEIIVTVKIDGPEIFEVVDAHAKKQGMRKKGSRFASP